MAKRHLTYSFGSLTEFITTYESAISKGGLFIDADRFEGELAAELKLDLVLPIIGRVGPLRAQVVHRAPDGGVGVRIPEMGEEAKQAFRKIFELVAEVRDYLVTTGQYISRADYDQAVQVAQRGAAQAGAGGGGRPRPASRGFPVPDMSSSESALQGSMSDRSLRDAMVQLAVEQVTGLMMIKYPDKSIRYGFWDRGGPVGWRTDPMAEDEVLGMLLFKAEQVTQEQIAQSLEIMEQTGSRQGEAFVQMGIMTYPQLIMVLGKQNEFVLQRVMQDRLGDWSFHLLPELPEQFLASAIKVPSLLFRALYSRARDLSSAELTTLLLPHLDQYLALDPASRQVISEIKFMKKERGLIDVIEGSSWRLRELYSVSPMSRAVTSAVIWALDEMGFLVFELTEDLERYLARVSGRISRKKSQLKDTHFGVLELHWICMDEDVGANYRRLKEEFKADRYHDLPEARLEDLGKINVRLDEAHAAVEAERARRIYRATVIEKDAITQSADLLGKKGEMAIMRQDKAEAISCFSKASELVPSEAKYRDGMRRSKGL
jgi:hypothetical protein